MPLSLLSIIESPAHRDYSRVYRRLALQQVKVNSIRKSINQLKKQKPDIIVAEFFYGYGNNYAGVNVSNLDVLLSSLQKYAPEAKVVVMVNKRERQYVARLEALFPVHGVMVHPVGEAEMESMLRMLMGSDEIDDSE